MTRNTQLSAEDAARTKEHNRRYLVDLLYRTRDAAPLGRDIQALGLDEDDFALILETFRVLDKLGALCGIELCPSGWEASRRTQANYAKFQVLSQRVVMNAVEMSILELKSF